MGMNKKLLWVAGAVSALALAMTACKSGDDTTGTGGGGGDDTGPGPGQGGGPAGVGGQGGGPGPGPGPGGAGGGPDCDPATTCNDAFTKPGASETLCEGAEANDFFALVDCACGVADAAGKFDGACADACKCSDPIADGPDKGKAGKIIIGDTCSTCANTSCNAELNKCTS
jgi:hypothetical protein